MSKLLKSIGLAAVVALSLVACSATTTANTASTACTPTKSGSSSEKVKVTGKFGAQPTVTFSTPLSTKSTERSVVIKGKNSAKAQTGSQVSINYAVYNATSGTEIDSTGFGTAKAQALSLDKASLIPGLFKAISCSTAGTRVAAIIPPDDAFKSEGSTQLGIAPTDSIIFVIDVVSAKKPVATLKKADGVEQPAPKGFPTVKLAKDGSPTITVPKSDPPTKTKIADLKKGSGATVKSGQTVTVHYTGVIYSTGKVFDSSWARGTPASFATTGVVKGFSDALVGQKVGSQVIAVIPPADGYGASGSSDGTIKPTDTIVFVIDILATQ